MPTTTIVYFLGTVENTVPNQFFIIEKTTNQNKSD